jgi:hypothetical protein
MQFERRKFGIFSYFPIFPTCKIANGCFGFVFLALKTTKIQNASGSFFFFFKRRIDYCPKLDYFHQDDANIIHNPEKKVSSIFSVRCIFKLSKALP